MGAVVRRKCIDNQSLLVKRHQTVMGHIGDKKRNNRNQDTLVSVPEYLRNFIESVGIRPDEVEQVRKPKQRKEKDNESSTTPVEKLAKNKVQDYTVKYLFITQQQLP